MARLEETLTHLDINLGDACNLRCVHCPCWINEKAPRFDAAALEARLSEAVDYIDRECPKFDKVMLIGGEPFVHEGVANFFENQRFESVCISAYTNFVWPRENLDLPPNIRFLSSLDAASQSVYGQLRRTRDFARSQENMRRYSDRLMHVDTTVSKGNLHHLDEILDITEPYGCSHWFLPIDPRVLRYAEHDSDRVSEKAETATEVATALRTAKRVNPLLLDDGDLKTMEKFFARRASSRTNDFDMFMGVYLSGIAHFQDDELDYRPELKIKRPEVERCAGIRRYMEITFTPDGQFVPMVHCPELWDLLGVERGPAFDSFSELMEWENEVRGRTGCKTFCGRTQFLGLDEYEETFQEVSVEQGELAGTSTENSASGESI